MYQQHKVPDLVNRSNKHNQIIDDKSREPGRNPILAHYCCREYQLPDEDSYWALFAQSSTMYKILWTMLDQGLVPEMMQDLVQSSLDPIYKQLCKEQNITV